MRRPATNLEFVRMQETSQSYSIHTFRYGLLANQECDLYLPDVSKPSVLCLLHGGFWRMPYSRTELTAVAKDLVVRGYAIWNVEYRRIGSPGGGWPGTLLDAVSAINFLATLVAHEIEIDLNRVVIIGHSAGGQLALCIAAQNRSAKISLSNVVHPFAVVGLAAVSDLAYASRISVGRSAVDEFLGGSPEQYPDRYVAASPIGLLPLGVKQLIIHGAKDEELPVGLSRSYAAAAQASGDFVEFVELPDAGHMDFVDPGSKAHAILCEWLKNNM
jgi:acetyl esterase/lipase